jgi:multiple sugar transport system ATP-binding protein
MATITFRGVSKRYGPVDVINALELEIRDREFMVLVGPSGCGKSTALRMIAGLEDVTRGELRIGERIVNDVAPKDRDVAMVFQNYALYPHMSVFENIAFGLRIRRMPAAEVRTRVHDAAAVLGLAQLLDRKPKALSGGQRQRVALGRAIVRQPAVFLFDEPLSNLDAELRVQMRAELARLQQKLQTTTVYVTHDQVEAMTLGHRIAVMAPVAADGRPNLQQVGAPLEIYDRPQNAFVARFIGSPPMNLLGVGVSADGAALVGPGFRAASPQPFAAALRAHAGQQVLLGVRPEHVHLAADSGLANPVSLRGVVDIAETVGPEVIVHARVGEERVVARLSARHSPRFGEPIELAINWDAVHVFDRRTEQRLATG